MVLARTDENELLTVLHEGLWNERPWRVFLERLRARAGADICILSQRGEDGWVKLDGAVVRSLDDPGLPVAGVGDAMRPGRVYRQQELAPGGEGDAMHMLIAPPRVARTLVSLLWLTEPAIPGVMGLLTALAPHIAIALKNRADADRREASIAHEDRVLRGLGVGWLLLDRHLVVVASGGTAPQIVARRGALFVAADGRLHCARSDAAALLDRLTGPHPDVPAAAWLDQDARLQMLVTRADPGETGACWLVLLRAGDRPALGEGRALSDLYRLTRSEVRLAARIGQGESIADAAAALSLTVETTRNYSKRIYLKTGARGQPDLAAMLLTGVGPLE